MIFIDSNVPMYLVGAAHPSKTEAQRYLERVISDGERLVTDAEVLQEILHRYVAIARRDAIQPAFDALPAGTVESLLKPENKDKLARILTCHVVAARAMAAASGRRPLPSVRTRIASGRSRVVRMSGRPLPAERRTRCGSAGSAVGTPMAMAC